MNHIPTRTLHDLALVVIYVAGAAVDGARRTLQRLEPHIRPPADLEVRSTNGSTYSGLLLLDDNEVIAGMVFRTGHQVPSTPVPSGARFDSPQPSSSWRGTSLRSRDLEEDDNDQGKLPGWAEDAREEDEWRPRSFRR